MNFQLIHVCPINPVAPGASEFNESNYIGIAIEDAGEYFYWAKGVSLKIKEWEYRNIKVNPKLYYFSTALKLHFQIKKIKEAEVPNDLI
jgi:hypothetical protein